jgi:large subunit ribosomal protein L15
MSLNKLSVPKGATKVRKRVGRGQASGLGKTAGRGGKGQKARSGNMRFEGFEGGQMPLQRRMPKFGFINNNRREFAEVKVGDLDGLQGVVDPAAMKAAGLIGKAADAVVVLAGGELKGAVSLKVHRVTAGARAAIEKAGGKIEIIPAPVTKYQADKAAKRAASAKAKA